MRFAKLVYAGTLKVGFRLDSVRDDMCVVRMARVVRLSISEQSRIFRSSKRMTPW